MLVAALKHFGGSHIRARQVGHEERKHRPERTYPRCTLGRSTQAAADYLDHSIHAIAGKGKVRILVTRHAGRQSWPQERITGR